MICNLLKNPIKYTSPYLLNNSQYEVTASHTVAIIGISIREIKNVQSMERAIEDVSTLYLLAKVIGIKPTGAAATIRMVRALSKG